VGNALRLRPSKLLIMIPVFKIYWIACVRNLQIIQIIRRRQFFSLITIWWSNDTTLINLEADNLLLLQNFYLLLVGSGDLSFPLRFGIRILPLYLSSALCYCFIWQNNRHLLDMSISTISCKLASSFPSKAWLDCEMM